MSQQLLKGDGKALPPLGTRWLMQNSDGTQWQTKGRYTREQVEAWDCSRPVSPIPDAIVPLVL